MTHEVTLETFLAHFNQAVAASTEEYRVTSVWRESHLTALISNIRAMLKTEGFQVSTLPPNQQLVEQLQRIGLAKELVITSPGEPGQRTPRFYRIDIGASLFSDPVDIAEILQSSLPGGVLCYSSAVRYYHLTTQNFSFQHIADVEKSGRDESASSAKKPPPPQPRVDETIDQPENASAVRRETLGTLGFIYEGVACYRVRRKSHTIPGIQERILSPRARIRITTLEQTLLDTLHKPFYCGGPSIVFEAWRQQPEKLNPAKLAKLVEKIGNTHLARRAGYMMETLQMAARTPWSALMERVLRQLDRTDEHNRLSLLPGVPYTSRSEKWMLQVP